MSETNTAATAGFGDAESHEQAMGLWSRRLAPLLIQFGGLSDRDRVLDVGCGTGSLTFKLPEIANVAEVIGIDLTESLADLARAHNTDPPTQLPDDRCSRFAVREQLLRPGLLDSGLTIHARLSPRGGRDASRRAARWGTVTAAVWDNFGLPHIRLIAHIAAVLDPSVNGNRFSQPLTAPNEMAELWRELGLWLIASLSDNILSAMTDHLRTEELSGRPDGPRSFSCVAWACRGTVPS